MTSSVPDFSLEGADPSIVYEDEADHQAQVEKQEWSFTTPADKAAAEEAAAEAIPEEDRLPVLKGIHEYPVPHPLIYLFRGIPMGELDDRQRPPMNVPFEVQQLMAIHAERAGVVIDPARVLIKHRAPTSGPDIAINPGTWHSVDEADPETGEDDNEPAPDLSGVSDAALDRLEEALRLARIEKSKLAQSDVPANDAAAAAEAAAKDESSQSSSSAPELASNGIPSVNSDTQTSGE